MTAQRPVLGAEEVWRAYDRMEARLTAPLSERMLDLARFEPGMRVLDLATGRGEPAIPAARRVGSGGSVLGIDISASMLAIAGLRAHEEGVTNLELRAMNAELLEGLPGAHSMRPSPAGASCTWTRPSRPSRAPAARWCRKACWSPRSWPKPSGARISAFLGACSHDTGPCRRSNRGLQDRYAGVELRQDLDRADLKIEHVEELTVPVMEAETTSEVIAWARAFGLTRLLNDLPESTQRSWEEDFAKEAEALRQDGIIRLDCATRIVVASGR